MVVAVSVAQGVEQAGAEVRVERAGHILLKELQVDSVGDSWKEMAHGVGVGGAHLEFCPCEGVEYGFCADTYRHCAVC
jgi:hypothetical protein